MECACIDMDTVCFSNILSDEILITARNIKCRECNRIIFIGEKYRREETTYEGELTIQETCIDCNSIRKAFVCGNWCWGGILVAIQESIYDCDGQVSEFLISSLTKPAQAKICEMIQRCWV